MDDKEMLELAARAAGLNYYDIDSVGVALDNGKTFNPLTKNDDAFWLLVRTNLVISRGFDPRPNEYQIDPYAATRRAIVRAAASIGQSMKEPS